MKELCMTRFGSRIVLLIIVLLVGQGCLGRSPAVRHFMLGTGGSRTSATQSLDVAVVVGPVHLPAYLDRAQIATLEGDGEIGLNEFNRWLGGFQENFLRAVSLGLARELGSARIVAEPSSAPFDFDYRIRLHVDDLIAGDGEGLRVRLRWALVAVREKGSAKLFEMDEVVAVEGGGTEDLVRAYDNAINELVRRISTELIAIESSG